MNKFEAFFEDIAKVIEDHQEEIASAVAAFPPSPIAIVLSGFMQAIEAIETLANQEGTKNG